LLKDIARADVLALIAAEIGILSQCAASGVHVPGDVAAVFSNHRVGKEVIQHRGRIINRQNDVRLGLVLNVQRLVCQRGQRGIGRRCERAQSDQYREQRGKPTP
jgi:hypothetical protein